LLLLSAIQISPKWVMKSYESTQILAIRSNNTIFTMKVSNFTVYIDGKLGLQFTRTTTLRNSEECNSILQLRR
jgi:hypothetical protein